VRVRAACVLVLLAYSTYLIKISGSSDLSMG
jgi:hypothetical protein